MAMAVADMSLQKAVHTKWKHYIAHYVGPNKDTAVANGLLETTKVELRSGCTSFIVFLFYLQAWDTVVNYMKLPSITEPLREFSE